LGFPVHIPCEFVEKFPMLDVPALSALMRGY